MIKKAQHSSLLFVVMFLSLTMIIIMGSSLYLWFAVPSETTLKINEKDQSVQTEHLLDTILQTTLDSDEK